MASKEEEKERIQRQKEKKLKQEEKERKEKEKLIKALSAFVVPKPSWTEDGFLGTEPFLKAFNEYKTSDKGYICSRDLEEFVSSLFADVRKEDVDIPLLKKYIHGYLFHFEHKRQRWISMYDLYEALEDIIDTNFLLNFRGRLKYSSVDVMQIWTYYNKDNSMTLDVEEAEIFVFDLLLTTKHRCNPSIVEALTNKLLEISEDEKEISLRGLVKLIPIEESILKQYSNLQELSAIDMERILSFYDQDDEGEINGCELYALIKDIFESNGQRDPYNMKSIHEAIKYLHQEGGITSEGNFDKKCLKTLFSLGLNETSL